MSGFFEFLVDKKLYEEWAKTLDWLIDDGKFDPKKGWGRGKVGNYIKRVEKLPHISRSQFKEDLSSPPLNNDEPIFIYGKGDGKTRGLVRHLRNGIAHGNTRFYKTKEGELYIEIIDYSDDATKKNRKQTAFLAFPVTLFPKLYKVYLDIEKSIFNDKQTKKTNSRKE